MERVEPAPVLRGLAPLVGTWRLALWGNKLLEKPEARVSGGLVRFEWAEDGAVLVMHQGGDKGDPPVARMIIGRDQDQDNYTALYSNARISRIYAMTVTPYEWRMWRDNAPFAQRFEAAISDDGSLITGRWARAFAGRPWQHEFNMEYSRIA